MSTNPPPPPPSRRSLRPITLAKSASSQTYEQDPDLALALAVSLVNDGKGPSPKLSLTGMKKKKKRQRANSDGKTNHDERDDKVLYSESIIIGETSRSDLEHELRAQPILDSHSSVILPESLQTTDLFSDSTLIPDDVLSQEIMTTTELSIDPMVDAISNNNRVIDLPFPLVSKKSIIDSSFTGIVPDILSQEFEESAVDEFALLRPDIISPNEQGLLAYQEICSSYIEAPDILSQEIDVITKDESAATVQQLIPSNERPSTQSIIDLSFSGPLDILSQEFNNHNQSTDECIVMKEESTSRSISINGSIIPQNEKLETRLYTEELNEFDSTSTSSQNLCLQKIRLSTEIDVAVSINEQSSTSSSSSSSSSSSLDTVTLFGRALVSRLTQRPRSVRMFASQHPANSPCEDFVYAGSNAEYTPSSTTTHSVSPIDLTYIFLVLDGHGGPVAASFGVTHLPGKIFDKTNNAKDTFSVVTGIKEAFEEVDKLYLATHSSDLNYCKFGSCVNLVLLRKVLLPTTLPSQSSSDSLESKSPSLPRWTIFTANVGDSRSVLSSQWDVTRYGQESLSCLVPSARSQLIDSRVHNRSADAAGIPSLLAASRISVPDRPVDVIKVVNECETSVITSVLQEHSYGRDKVSSTISRNKAECFDLHAKCIAYSVIGDTVSTSSLSPLQIAKEQCRKMLRSNNTVAIPLSVDHTCANPLEADDVKARCWDKTPIRPNIFGFNPTFINRGEESLTSTTSSLISRSSSLKAGTSGIMSQPPREYDISMHRVAGSLMVTRALGDHYLKSSLHSPPLFSSGCPYISCEPEVHWRVLQPQDMFALMGCDGIWDNVTNAEAIEIVTIALQNEALQPILETLNKNLNELQTEGEDGGTDTGHDTGADTGADTGPEATKHFTTAIAALSDVLLVDTLGSPIPVRLGVSSLPILNSSTSTTDYNNSIVTLGIESLEDVVFGNPAQRIVGASLLVAASRHVESAKRLWHTNISLEASVSQLLAKSPKVSDPKQKNHRRGIHDDLSALVILFPQFMIDENQAADKSCYKDDTPIQSIQSCAMEGVDLFIFSSPSTRFNKESIDAQLAMRMKSRSARTVKVEDSDRLVQSQAKSTLLSWLKKPV